MRAEELVGRLDGARRTAVGSWMARCPAHEDRSPSLHISQDGEKVLLCCHAGCSQEAVVSAAGLRFADLFTAPADGGGFGKGIVDTYPYEDEQGNLLFEVVRYEPKAFRQRRPNPSGGWEWRLNGTRRVLYRLPILLEATRSARPVYVVEGEKDVHAIERMGGVATCSPMGAGKWRTEYSEALRGAHVHVVADLDEAGRQHAAQVARSLSGTAASVTLLRPAAGKDAHDHSEAGFGLEDFAPLDEELGAETTAEPVHVFRTLEALLQQPELLSPPQCVLPRIGYRGRGVLLCGPDKSGKSTLVAHGAAALSRGRPWLGEETTSGRVVWCGLEEATGDAVRRFQALDTVTDAVQVMTYASSELIDAIDALLTEWPADLWILDSLQEYARVTCGATPADGDNGSWGSVIRPLIGMARKHDVALVMLHHVRRSDGEGRGATEIFAAVDATLTLRMPRKGDNPWVRHIQGRGRWPVEPFEVQLTGGRYDLAGSTQVTLEEAVGAYVSENPSASKKSIRDAVRARATAVDAAISALEDRGILENRGTGARQEWHVVAGRAEVGGP